MRSLLFSVLFSLLTLLPSALTLGINCRGDRQCEKHRNPGLDKDNDLMDEFYQALANGASWHVQGGPIDRKAIYQYGQDIACYPPAGLCVYTTGTVTRGMNTINGSVIVDRVGDLNYHGCWYCGSVPLSGDNKPEELGILVVNYVGGKVPCNGVCKY